MSVNGNRNCFAATDFRLQTRYKLSMREKEIIKRITVIFALFFVCFLSGCDWNGMSAEPDDYEENDSFGQAAYITEGSHMILIFANFYDDGLDYYLMDLSGDTTINVGRPDGHETEMILYVFDIGENLITSDADGNDDFINTVTFNAVSGQYYVVAVSTNGSGEMRQYSLTWETE